MLDWTRRRISTTTDDREADVEPAETQRRVMSGKYRSLYKYLKERYANTSS
jgi:hypothetical protein